MGFCGVVKVGEVLSGLQLHILPCNTTNNCVLLHQENGM
jgi:hypothetical protein